MTEGEFMLQRLKDELSMYRVLFVVCVAAGIASIVLMVVATSMRGPDGFFVFISFALFFASWGFTCKSKRDSLESAFRDVGDDPEGIISRHDLPKQTVLELAQLHHPTKTYLQLVIAYGLCAIMLLAGSVVIYVVAFEERELVFAALASLLVLGFLWLAVLTFQSARNWRASKQLDALGN